MKTVVKKVRQYCCETCRSTFNSADQARQCERRRTEKKRFRRGSKVELVEPRFCTNGRKYRAHAKVVRILGPFPADREYETKWLGSDPIRLNSHVYVYEVEFKCPVCRKTERHRYYAPELKPA